MRTLALLVSTTLTAVIGLAQGNAELSQVQTVYLMPMANGFDQYLANRLRNGVNQIRIVTDPSKADAVFTDRIGTSFEAKLEEMEEAAKEKVAAVAPVTSPLPQDIPHNAGPVGDTPSAGFKFAPKISSSAGRGRGTYFLVDRRSRLVLWSTYKASKDMQPKTLNGTAGKIAEELERDFIGKK
ncbi:hypothetical protein [Bryobacter aggregatus]|uniref:hypothetical protein n=1 Tax=Bryobacter aggregatus TaxID=360054 RepID=UPI0004E1E4E4|nr:hypothetical protein [Bryobacter aggregatus]